MKRRGEKARRRQTEIDTLLSDTLSDQRHHHHHHSLLLCLLLSPSLALPLFRDLFMQLKSKERPVSSSCAWLDAVCERDNCSSRRRQRQRRQQQQQHSEELVSFPCSFDYLLGIFANRTPSRPVRPPRLASPLALYCFCPLYSASPWKIG